MSSEVEREAVARIGAALGAPLELDGEVLRFGGAEWSLPEKAADWDKGNLRHAFPSRAHGDQREKLVYKIVQDATTSGPTPRILDAVFRSELPEAVQLADPVARQVVAAAISDEYWTEVMTSNYLVPYHSLLPGAFDHTTAPRNNPTAIKAARYKLFPGIVLPFLCWTPAGVDTDLVQAFLDVMNSEEDFSRLDRLLVDAAREVAGDVPGPAEASELMRGALWAEVAGALAQGAFAQPALDQFQRDLRTVLSMRETLPRRDLVDLLTALLSLHLAVHYYRVAVVFGSQLDRVVATLAGITPPVAPADGNAELAASPLAGRMRFRVGTRGDRPVRLTDPCTTSYRELTDQRLLALPAAIITANLTHELWQALGGAPARTDLQALEQALRADAAFAGTLDAAAAALAALYTARTRRANQPLLSVAELVEIGARKPGLFALRQAVTATRRTRLRNLSRDIVNQLAKRESGSLIRSRGNAVTFFELDEDFLFLLVKLVCRQDQVDFATFLNGLAEYGLAPQDDAERELLIATLERLGMLRRYADAGESIYVRHPIS
jgi:hypothetical protein